MGNDRLTQLRRALELGVMDQDAYDFFLAAATAHATGAVAQGEGAVAVGQAGVGVLGGNTGTISTGTLVKIDSLNVKFLEPLTMASALAKELAQHLAPSAAAAPIGAPTPAAVQLRNLVEELRRTHKTLVDLLDPLWDIADAPATFASEFKPVYRQFRRFYNGTDLGTNRTHCHIITSIRTDLSQARPKGGADELTWAHMENTLQQLDTSDKDLIDEQYRPFMKEVFGILGEIDRLLSAQPPDVPQAIQIKRALQGKLQIEFDATKAKFEEMNDTIDQLDDALRRAT